MSDLDREAAARVHYVDPRVRQLAEARWRLANDGSQMDWLALGKNNPEALIEEGRDWIRAAVAAGILLPPGAEDALRAELAQTIEHRDHWHAEAMSATRRIVELEPGAPPAPADRPSVPGVVAAIVAALRERAGELSDLAEERLERSLEEQAQEWHEAANVAERTARRLADEAQQGEGPKPVPPVGYSGMGRVWCLSCPRPANENVPLTARDIHSLEECTHCGRNLTDLAEGAQR